MTDPHLDELREALAPAGAVRARAMFGGAGLYLEDVFFGLVADGELYFRVDDASRPEYEAAGSAPFQPFQGKAPMGTYWRVPDRVQSEPRELRAWTRRALEAARAARKSKPPRATSRRAPKDATDPTMSILRMRIPNVGPAARRWMREVGVATRGDLERRGSVATFRAVRANGRRASVNLLYALEGALLGLRGDLLPEVVRANLRERAGL
ncbi:MAG: TfoX/Sxy family protein [Planctomycetota bacterium]|nr:TfoX/Sxy family protein [Planctomycetota bacterium]